MAALLSAPTLSASDFAEYIDAMDAPPLCHCPPRSEARSATPTMSRSRSYMHNLSDSFASSATGPASAGPSFSFGYELCRVPTRDEREDRFLATPEPEAGRRRWDSTPSSPSSKRWSLLRPRLRRSESDDPPRRSSRSKSPVRAKSTKSGRSSRHPSTAVSDRPASRSDRAERSETNRILAAFSFGALKKEQQARDTNSPQPLPCLEACTGPPSPTVEFASTATTLIDRDPFDDEGIIWVVPRSRRGSRASSYSPTRTKWITHAVPEPQSASMSMADIKREARRPPPPVPTNKRRIERISNWGLPHQKEDGVWSKLTVTWWRRKSA